MVIIVTNCSKRKRIAPAPDLCAGSLNAGSLEAVTKEWIGRVKSAKPCSEAGRLYCGRQFHESLQSAQAIDADLLVVSAGLGVLRCGDLVPSYNLTVAPGSSDSVQRVINEVVDASRWWQSLSEAPGGFFGLREALGLATAAEDLILIAMPSSYLRMIERELEQFSPKQLSATRIFTAGSFRFQHTPLNELIIPYDRRLDGPSSSCRGTAADFPARALRHFSTTILPRLPHGSLQEHCERVSNSLNGWCLPFNPQRKRLPNDAILDLIRENWGQYGNSSSKMLNRIRRDIGVSCEQGRMSELFEFIKSEKGTVN